MSADIINLRRARKAKERQAADKRAEENRAKFGRTKSERQMTTAEKEREGRRLDRLRRDRHEDETAD
jgi:hypothetical protein